MPVSSIKNKPGQCRNNHRYAINFSYQIVAGGSPTSVGYPANNKFAASMGIAAMSANFIGDIMLAITRRI